MNEMDDQSQLKYLLEYMDKLIRLQGYTRDLNEQDEIFVDIRKVKEKIQLILLA